MKFLLYFIDSQTVFSNKRVNEVYASEVQDNDLELKFSMKWLDMRTCIKRRCHDDLKM